MALYEMSTILFWNNFFFVGNIINNHKIRAQKIYLVGVPATGRAYYTGLSVSRVRRIEHAVTVLRTSVVG